MATFKFGVSAGTAAGTFGLAQSVNDNDDAQIAEVKDEDGHTAGINVYDETKEISLDIVFDTTKTAPGIGDTLALTPIGGSATVNFTVTKVGKTQSNNDFQKLSVTAKRWVNNSLPAA